MWGGSLQQHQRQPQREQNAHDDHGDEAHAPEGLALNVGDTEQEADAGGHAAKMLVMQLRGEVVLSLEGDYEIGVVMCTEARPHLPKTNSAGTSCWT